MALALKFLSFLLRAIEFACAAIILAIYSYFLATLKDHSLHIDTSIRAVEGISGAAVLYLIFALVLVWCLGGVAFFSLLGMVLDLAFMGAFIYVAFENRHGANSCTGTVTTPFGTGLAGDRGDGGTNGVIHLPKLRTACRLETAAFSLAIIAIFFFLLSCLTELLLARHHRHEKAFGPSPTNNYTRGSSNHGLRLPWQRKPRDDFAMGAGGLRDPDALPAHQTPSDFVETHVPVRKSYQSGSEATSVPNGGEMAHLNGAGVGNGVGAGGYTSYENGLAAGSGGISHTAPYPMDDNSGTYDRYGNSPGYPISNVGERTEMPGEVPVSGVARNY